MFNENKKEIELQSDAYDYLKNNLESNYYA